MRYVAGALCAAALLSGCSGGSGASADLPTFTEEPPVEDNAVHTVEEFIQAVQPNATVTLPSGTLMISDGEEAPINNPYCWWDNGSLVISNVDGLTIQGGGKDVSVVKTDPRDATVFVFRNCRDLTLTGFTAGHTQRSEACQGDVLDLEGCSNMKLSNLGLFGCGTVGISGYMLRDLTVTDTDIYDCSVYGINIYDSGNLKFENCRIYDLGDEQVPAGAAIDLGRVLNVSITDTQVENCITQNLIWVSGSNVTMENCTVKNNASNGELLWTYPAYGETETQERTSLTLKNVTFAENTGWRWLGTEYDPRVLDENGNVETEESLTEKYGEMTLPESKPASGDVEDGRETITVTNVDEFLEAIGPDREIVIDCPELDLSKAKNYGTSGGAYYYWDDPFDGPQLVIQNVENMTIRGKDGAGVNCISAVPRYAQVLSFNSCSDITLKDLTAGHTKEPGYCLGGVLRFTWCSNVTVENTGLFGCGTIGVDSYGCSNLLIQNNDIYECSYGGVNLYASEMVTMQNNRFRALGDYGIGYIYATDESCRNILFEGESVQPGLTLETVDYPGYQE